MTDPAHHHRDEEPVELPPEVLVSVERALKAGEAERLEILAEVKRSPADPRVVELFRSGAKRHLAEMTIRRRTRNRARVFALAAGLLLAVATGWLANRDVVVPTTDPGSVLAGSEDRLTWIAPKGRVTAFTEFRCQATADFPSDTSFELILVDLDSSSNSKPPPIFLLAPEWRPTAQQAAALPRRLRATMRAISPDGEVLSTVVTEAQRDD